MATDLAGLRIGVQRGSVYATWASQNLVDPGWISESDLFVYDKPENAVRDLKESRLDAVMLDLLPAQQAVADGGVRLAGYGLASQQYAIAVKKGAALTGELNTALAVMETDGTISRLMEEYLHRAPPSGPVQPTPPLLPPAPCVDAARFIQDLTYDDGNMTKPPIFEPGQIFQKGWRLENTGTCTWDPSTRVAFARGNVPAAQMYGVPAAIPGTVAPGGSVDVFVNLVSPLVDGTYQGFWQLVNPASVSFGEVFWVGITVSSGEVIPTPDPQGAPTIKSFRVEPSTIVVNECVTVRWKVAGDTDRIVIEDNTGKVLWGDAPREGKLSDCLATAGAFGYTVTARGPGGTTTDTDKVNVVNAGPSDPSVLFFSASPQKIKQGECTGLSWTTTGASAAVALLRDGTTPAEDLPENGDYTDCPRGTGTQVYKLTAASPSSTVARSVQVIVEEDLIEPR